MAIPVTGGQPATQTIPKLGSSSLSLPVGVALSTLIPVNGGQPSTQTIPVAPGFEAVVLAVADQGGQSVGDRYGAWPTLTVGSDDIVIDPYTGEYAQVENGWDVAGTEVGTPEPYIGAIGKGDGSLSVVNAPASQRRQGFDQMDFTNYLSVTLSQDKHCFVGHATLGPSAPTGENPFFGIDASDHRWGIQFVGANEVEVKLFDNSTVRATATVTSASAFAAGEEVVIAGGCDSEATATVNVLAWDDTGTGIGSDSSTWGGGVTSLAGVYAVGRGRGGGDFTNGTLHAFGGFDGERYSGSEFGPMKDAILAGTDVDTLAATYGGVWVDGVTRGWYSRIATELLGELSGTGGMPIVVAPSAAGPTYTQPQDFADLMTDHDALRGATYDGGNFTTSIPDYSGNGYHLTVANPLTSKKETLDLLGRSVYLPSSPGGLNQTPEAAFSETVGDFTVVCLIPMQGVPGTLDYYYTLNQTTNWALRVGTTISSEQDIYLVDDSGAGVSGTEMTGVFSAFNGPAAHMIVVFRRSVIDGEITCDAWYDQDLGGGVVKVAQRVATDTFSASLSVTGAAAMGRNGSSIGQWQGIGLAFHRGISYKRALTDSEMLALVKGQAARIGWDPADVA